MKLRIELPLMIHRLSVRAITRRAVWKCNGNMFMSGWIVMLE